MRVLLLALLLLLPSHGWAGEALVNSDVSVDVLGKDAADARTQAMAKAEVDALLNLLDRFSPGQGKDIVATLDAKKISSMVKGTEVLDEKIADNRYRARLLISFDADDVSNLVSKFTAGSGKDALAVATGSFLIIPVYDDAGTVTLWEEGNPWLNAWKNYSLEITSGDIVVPYGDHIDASVVNATNASSVTYSALVPLTIRYGVSDVVILQAKYTSLPDPVLSVVKRRTNRARNEINLLTYRADLQETRDALLLRAAQDVVDGLQNKKTEELSIVQGVRGGERNKVLMLASISTLASWTHLRAKLSSLPMIDKMELVAMSAKQVDMIVHYRGSPESLATAVMAQKIRLVQNKDYWVVSRD